MHYRVVKTNYFHPYNGKRGWGVKLYADDGTKSIVRYTTSPQEAENFAKLWNQRERGHKYGN